MRTKDISLAGIVNKVTNAPRNTSVEIITLTEAKMNKNGKDEVSGNKIPNPFYGQITKRSHIVGEIKYNYMDLVNRQRITEGKQATFVPDNRQWGDADGSLVSQNGSIYLNVRVRESLKTEYFFNGNPIAKKDIEMFLVKTNSSSEKQGVKEEIIVRNYKIGNIKELKIGQTFYTVK